MTKKIISWILVLIWMGIIFYFSSFNGEESTEQSRGFIYNTLGNIVEFFNKDITSEEKEILICKYDPIVRKLAHMFVYFILSILVCVSLNNYNLDIRKIILYSFLICFLYACSDEIHQTYVGDRSGKFLDVIIDGIGFSLGNMIIYLKNKGVKNDKCSTI